uniref:Uncharacterized protein n=1 Tax=Siphoviridae sp. cthrG7 TaxID=2826428 RepID=A0A8S5MCA0_9CAUD|nr:MAG TPA: Protein of unknown function (DUF2847) [Siphoviridae sp. cthrG7]
MLLFIFASNCPTVQQSTLLLSYSSNYQSIKFSAML